MDKFYPPYFPCYIPLPNGKPAAGGKLYAYYTGTDNLAPLYAEDGTILMGSVADIDSSGQVHVLLDPAITYRLKVVPPVGSQMPDQIYDNVRVANGTIVGMQNPMTDQGDLIVGAVDGEPARLGVGSDGDILATASGSPTWEAGPKKYRAVYQNIPSPQIDDGYLGCLFYLSDAGQTLNLPSAATIPPKAFIDFVCLNDTATLTITPQGTTALNEQTTAVTIGGKSASMYRLTFLGHGGSGDEWALGGSGNGDHKVSADGTDTAGYLEDKLGAGSGISLATSAGKVVVSAATQTGDHKVLASATDSTAAGSLNEKVLAIYPLKKELTTTGSPATEKLNIKLNTSDDVSNVGDVLTRTAGGADWAAIPTQTGDHKTAVDGADTSPDYLAAKLSAGSGISLTNTGSAVSIAADAQAGDHHVVVTGADASAGTLADKLVAGSNVTLTPLTDGDGVQTLEIAATGGGGGGGSKIAFPNYNGWGYLGAESFANNFNGHLYYGLLSPTADCTPRKAYARCRGTQYIGGYTKNYVGIYEWTSGTSYSLVCASDNLTGVVADSLLKVIEFNFSTTAKIYANKIYMFAWLSDKQWSLSKASQYYMGGSTNKLWCGHFAASSLPASFDANSGTAERYQPFFDILADL